jgi:hypothetical protein
LREERLSKRPRRCRVIGRIGMIEIPRVAALWKVRHLCTRAEHVRASVPGSYILIQAIMSAIDDYAERETGNREYFWGNA